MNSSVSTLCVALLASGCSQIAAPSYKDPSACIAAFQFILAESAGTPLAGESAGVELHKRIAFEKSKLINAKGYEEKLEAIDRISDVIRDDNEIGYDLAGHCGTEQELSSSYDSFEGN